MVAGWEERVGEAVAARTEQAHAPGMGRTHTETACGRGHIRLKRESYYNNLSLANDEFFRESTGVLKKPALCRKNRRPQHRAAGKWNGDAA